MFFDFISGIFVVIPIFWRKELLCSNDNLFIAVAEPTTFCQIQGTCVDLVHINHLFYHRILPRRCYFDVLTILATVCFSLVYESC